MKDWILFILGLVIIIGFFGVFVYIFCFGLFDEGSEVLFIMVGVFGIMISQVGNFFFGFFVGLKFKDVIIFDFKGVSL